MFEVCLSEVVSSCPSLLTGDFKLFGAALHGRRAAGAAGHAGAGGVYGGPGSGHRGAPLLAACDALCERVAPGAAAPVRASDVSRYSDTQLLY